MLEYHLLQSLLPDLCGKYIIINNGVPAPRVAEYPGAFTAHTKEQLIRNTREILWPQIVKGLTEPIGEDEISANALRDKGDTLDDVFYGTLHEVSEFFQDMKCKFPNVALDYSHKLYAIHEQELIELFTDEPEHLYRSANPMKVLRISSAGVYKL